MSEPSRDPLSMCGKGYHPATHQPRLYLAETIEKATGQNPDLHATGPLNAVEGELLTRLVRNERATRALEIGRGWGFSTLAIVLGLEYVPFRGPLSPPGSLVSVDHGPPGDSHLAKVLGERRTPVDVQLLIKSAKAHFEGLKEETYDFAFIDGDHSYRGVKADLQACKAVMVPGSLVVLHDFYHPDWHEGIKQALNEEMGDTWVPLRTAPGKHEEEYIGDGFALTRIPTHEA